MVLLKKGVEGDINKVKKTNFGSFQMLLYIMRNKILDFFASVMRCIFFLNINQIFFLFKPKFIYGEFFYVTAYI